ncbi:MAG: aldo/keto reductase [Planctomycetes bacterium]|nr:aldo/keto reductase [Planctomycetota bacterium]
MTYTPAADRYGPFPNQADKPASAPRSPYRRCGRSGLFLPQLSLGLWHNFGAPGPAGISDEREFHENARQMCFTALDNGVTHFDLANNYGPPPGAAETRFGKILKEMPRDEMVVATKAGWTMWPGPYGDFGSRKYLIASLDQSLRRMDMEYVDIFYHHRPDPGGTPIEETMAALEHIVRTGKALYVGISSYSGKQTHDACRAMAKLGGPPLLIHQAYYNMLGRGIETDLLPVTAAQEMGVIAFCPLAQGQLTDRYLKGIPKDSRAGSDPRFLKPQNINDALLAKVGKLNDHARQRGQSLAQMALAWTVRNPTVTSALIGASRPAQIVENIKAFTNTAFTAEELKLLDAILAG